jgi:outer membrane cobalamin receptor
VVITAEQIVASGATTVWEALRRTVTSYTFRETGNGTPVRIDHRGRSSMNLSDHPIVLLDGVQLADIRVLEQMPASDVLSIEVLSGISATTYYGTNANNGVIAIRTR